MVEHSCSIFACMSNVVTDSGLSVNNVYMPKTWYTRNLFSHLGSNVSAKHILSGRFYNLAGTQNGILKKGREVFLTGCYLRTASEGSDHTRLLPTEYLVILLDEVTKVFS